MCAHNSPNISSYYRSCYLGSCVPIIYPSNLPWIVGFYVHFQGLAQRLLKVIPDFIGLLTTFPQCIFYRISQNLLVISKSVYAITDWDPLDIQQYCILTTIPHSVFVVSIDIEVSRLTIWFQKVCIIRLPHQHHPQFCVAYSTSTGSIYSNNIFTSLVKPTSWPISPLVW